MRLVVTDMVIVTMVVMVMQGTVCDTPCLIVHSLGPVALPAGGTCRGPSVVRAGRPGVAPVA